MALDFLRDEYVKSKYNYTIGITMEAMGPWMEHLSW